MPGLALPGDFSDCHPRCKRERRFARIFPARNIEWTLNMHPCPGGAEAYLSGHRPEAERASDEAGH
jgi:hypothetical protein